MENLEINNMLNLNNENNIDLQEKQNNFLETNMGKIVNTGLEIGLKAILPDFIENDVIEIKNDLFENGIKEALNTTLNKVINLGKNIIGLVTGNIKDLKQAKDIVKEGGLIDSISNLIDNALEKCEKNGIIKKNISNLIKTGKDAILNNIDKNVNLDFNEQYDKLEKLDNYIEKWEEFYNKKDFKNMDKYYNKIENILDNVLPLENTILKAKKIENIHNLIKNNGYNFNLTENEIELSNKILL